jgi:hypothetical protein
MAAGKIAFIPYTARHSDALLDFIEYCRDHPGERFWQALRNWSRYNFVLVTDQFPGHTQTFNWLDTFSFEERRHDT